MRHVEARVENGLAKREGSLESWENIAIGKYIRACVSSSPIFSFLIVSYRTVGCIACWIRITGITRVLRTLNNIDFSFVLRRLENGVCIVTGEMVFSLKADYAFFHCVSKC